MARTISAQSPMEVAAVKEQLRCLASAVSLHAGEFERLENLRRQVYRGSDYAEGLRAFHEKRIPLV